MHLPRRCRNHRACRLTHAYVASNSMNLSDAQRVFRLNCRRCYPALSISRATLSRGFLFARPLFLTRTVRSDMSSSGQTYNYEPLESSRCQIRLLKLRPGLHYHILECDILIFDLADAPPYVALSYIWGQTSPTASAYIDKKPLRIRQNLFDFLQTYRNDPHNIDYVWVDQICIAQADVKERNSQVRLMPRIYSKCLEAIVWLGSNVRHLAWKLAGTAPLPMPALLKCKLVTEIFRHEYFSRLWVIQEILLPPSVRMLC